MPIPDPACSRAVLIGIDTYTHPDVTPLPEAAAGARRLAELLHDTSVWGLPAGHVTVLGAKASSEQILSVVRDQAQRATDTLLVYFAGHGLRDRNDLLYLALAGADPDHPQIGTLLYRPLRDVLRQAGHQARYRLTVLDCCFSGLAGAQSATTVPTRDDLARTLEEPTDGQADGVDDHGDCLLTSAPPTARSYVLPGALFPEFTGELISILEHGIADAGPTLSVDDAWQRIRRHMHGRNSPEPQQFAQNDVARQVHFHNRAHPRGQASHFDSGAPSRAVPDPRQSTAPAPSSTELTFALATSVDGPVEPANNFDEIFTPPVSHTRRRRVRMITLACAVAVAITILGSAILPDILDQGHGKPLRQPWHYETASGAVGATPVVTNGTVYVTGIDGTAGGKIHALDAASGRKKWVYSAFVDTEASSLAVGDNTVFVGGNGVLALNAANGDEKWGMRGSVLLDLPHSALTVWDSLVYIGMTVKTSIYDPDVPALYALDTTTGKVKWSYRSATDVTQPIVAKGTLFVGIHRGLYALDARTGKKKWSTRSYGEIHLRPAAADGWLYVADGKSKIYALDETTGSRKWTYQSASKPASPPVVSGATLYYGGSDKNLYALNAATGAKNWSLSTGSAVTSPPVVSGGTVYCNANHTVYALDAATGEKKWSHSVDGVLISSPAVAAGRIYVGDDTGKVYALDAATGIGS